MLYTTLNRIRQHSPCKEGWQTLLDFLGKSKADDESLSYLTILESNGLEDVLWCCRAEPQYASIWRHLAVDFAEEVRHLMTDERSLAALKVARLHADSLATDEELKVAWAAAWAAADTAADTAAWAAADTAAWAAAWAAADAPSDAAKHKQKQPFIKRVS